MGGPGDEPRALERKAENMRTRAKQVSIDARAAEAPGAKRLRGWAKAATAVFGAFGFSTVASVLLHASLAVSLGLGACMEIAGIFAFVLGDLAMARGAGAPGFTESAWLVGAIVVVPVPLFSALIGWWRAQELFRGMGEETTTTGEYRGSIKVATHGFEVGRQGYVLATFMLCFGLAHAALLGAFVYAHGPWLASRLEHSGYWGR